MRTTTYSVRTQVLYPSMRTMWLSARTYHSQLSAELALITDDYINESFELILAAEAMPNEAARVGVYEMKRIEMEPLAAACCSKFRFLKIYVRGCFLPDMQDAALNEAGWEDYEGAAHQNWGSVSSMMVSMLGFIADNSVKLQADGTNMPIGYPATVSATADAFNTAWEQYRTLRQEAEILTAQKVEANNAIYARTMEMASLGVEVFYNNDEVRKQFVFDSVVGLVAPGGPSGVIIEVTNAADGKPLLAEVTDMLTDRRVEANPNGIAEMNNLRAGDTTFLITCDGFAQQAIDYTLKTSTTSRIKVALTAMVMKGVGAEAVVPDSSNGQVKSSVQEAVATVSNDAGAVS